MTQQIKVKDHIGIVRTNSGAIISTDTQNYAARIQQKQTSTKMDKMIREIESLKDVVNCLLEERKTS